MRPLKCLSLCLLSSLFVGCGIKEDSHPVSLGIHADKKLGCPKLALTQVVDTSNNVLPWSLSEEMTMFLSDKLEKSPHLQITPHSPPANEASFSNDTSWMSAAFPGVDFVAFVETGKHSQEKVKSASFGGNRLVLQTRLRVVDLRGETPKIILQEVLEDERFLPPDVQLSTLPKDGWKQEFFNLTPVGIIHKNLAKDLANRIETYVSLNQHE